MSPPVPRTKTNPSPSSLRPPALLLRSRLSGQRTCDPARFLAVDRRPRNVRGGIRGAREGPGHRPRQVRAPRGARQLRRGRQANSSLWLSCRSIVLQKKKPSILFLPSIVWVSLRKSIPCFAVVFVSSPS